MESSLRLRILELSYKHKLSHLGSCLTALPILIEIFNTHPERFVLSAGHAGVALYCLLEALHGVDVEMLLTTHGIHPIRGQYIDCSTGSLGMGLTVACGYALTEKRTACLISDGECAEGSIWEALAFRTQHQLPLQVYVNMNGYSAYSAVDVPYLEKRLLAFDPTIQIRHTTPGAESLVGLDAHYHTLTQEEYAQAIC